MSLYLKRPSSTPRLHYVPELALQIQHINFEGAGVGRDLPSKARRPLVCNAEDLFQR